MTAHDVARIHALSERLANQIAAGEVVERPASVLKELLENSLDAGATHINVDVEQGGTRLIRVRDDGSGIHHDDLALALHRHATSKIATLEDLVHVASLGFRGEALPSVASVSRLELCSCAAGEDRGYKVVAGDSWSAAEVEPAAHPQGTTVTVRDLFYNTPARRKFLRTEKTEFRHIEDVVKRAALSRFDCAFSLRHNARASFTLPPAAAEAERDRRVAKLCGAAFVDRALTLAFEAEGLAVSGWVGAPGYSRGVSDLQYFFVNGRMVRDNLLRHAVRHAHDGIVESGRHPAYVLFLSLDPAQVDVNVHPSKHEVRFRDARSVHEFVARSVRMALSGALSGHGRADALPARPAAAMSPHSGSVREHLEAYEVLRTRPRESSSDSERPLGEALHAVDGRYLVARSARGLMVVDARQAMERVAAEQLRSALANGPLSPRPLLVPITIEVDIRRADLLEEQAERLERLGFDVRRVAPRAVSCRGIPAALAGASPAELVASLGDVLREESATPSRGSPDAAPDDVRSLALFDAVLARCDLARDQSWDHASMNTLLRDLERLEHGPRPPSRDRIWRVVEADDIARWLAAGVDNIRGQREVEQEAR